jgi:long-chain acyl-CoA synthetase
MRKLNEILVNAGLSENSIPGIEINTYLKLWNRVIFLSKERNGKRADEFVPIRSGKFLEQQFFIAAGLLELGVEKGEFVAVYSPNSLRYAINVFAILSVGAVFVPIYPTIGEEIVEYLLYDSNTRYIFVGDEHQYEKVYAIMNKVRSPLRKVIANFPSRSNEQDVLTFDQLISIGERSDKIEEVVERIKNLSEDDLAAMLYTLGSEGVFKGAMLSHGNFIAQKGVTGFIDMDSDDIRLAHLPFSHVFGLSADLFSSALIGSAMAICSSFETEEVLRNISEIRPTLISSVPRMYEKIYIYVTQRIGRFGRIRRSVYHAALELGKTCFIRQSRGERIPLTERMLERMYSVLYRKIRRSLGLNNIRYLFSGGGPLAVDVAYFFGSIGLPILEGYGLTETAPVINMNRPESIKPGTVGPPIPGVEERISEEGEILVRGPVVFRGYYKMSDEMRDEIFTEDGFFKTGDIGTFDEDGNLIITERLKDIIITSGGKNVAPMIIEQRFDQENLIDHICIVGDRRKYLTALVVPNFENVMRYARDHNIAYKDRENLVKNKDIIDLYKSRIDMVSNTFARFEQIKKFSLLPNEFSVESGELTANYRFKRNFIEQKYKEVIDEMYPSSELI